MANPHRDLNQQETRRGMFHNLLVSYSGLIDGYLQVFPFNWT
jgi:hypothetical protein